MKSSNKENLLFKDLEINYENNKENFYDVNQINILLKFFILAAYIKLSIFGLNENNKSKSICKAIGINLINPCVASSIVGITIMQLLWLIFDEKEMGIGNEEKWKKWN